MVDGKDPEWLKGGIMNDGFVMQSFNGMIDKDEVKRQLGARRIQCVACYAQQHCTDPDDCERKTMRYFCKGAFAYSAISDENIRRWSDAMINLRSRVET